MKTIPVNPKIDAMFVCASVLLALGLGLTLLTTHVLASPRQFWPIPVGLLGALASYFILTRQGKAKLLFLFLYLFLASTLSLVGIILSVEMRRLWPLYMILAGFSILPAGHIRFHRFLPGYGVPALAFIVLGSLFCVFSFGFSSMRFGSFLAMWWPGFFLSGGIILFVLYFMSRSVAKPRGKDSGKQ